MVQTGRFSVGLHICLSFEDRRVHSYMSNSKYFKGKGIKLSEVAKDVFSVIEDALKLVQMTHVRPIRVGFDYSSCTRAWIAEIARAFIAASKTCELTVDWFYAAATFSSPSISIAPTLKSSPLTSYFAGKPHDPELPLTLVIGMGLEFDKALGVSELLEPARVYAFLPHGDEGRPNDRKYSKNIKDAYKRFEEIIGPKSVFDFNVYDPISLISELDSLIHGALRDSRVVIAPFGPKCFLVAALLASLRYERRIGLWHITSGYLGEAIDRKPNGRVVAFRTKLKLSD